jgi:glycosyltransferase involved in cell wall biosynthesis
LVFDALRLLGELAARVELVIVGAPRGADAERYLEELLESYQGPAATIQRGFVEPSRMADQYASIDILVVPSIVPEAFGLTVAEAFSVGRPVIVSKSGALPELVRDGIDGFVVGRNDSHILAERMHSLILNPSSILALADAAPPVRSIEDYADAIERVYDSVMAKGEPAAAHL